MTSSETPLCRKCIPYGAASVSEAKDALQGMQDSLLVDRR